MKIRNRKGQLGTASNMAVSLLLLVLIVAVGAIVINDIRATEGDRACNTAPFTTYNSLTDVCDNTSGGTDTTSPDSLPVNISTSGLSGLSNMSAQFGTVGTVIIAAVLISLVIGAFALGRR